MPEIALFEPGKSGHRPVILRYIQSQLEIRGVDPIVITEDLWRHPFKLIKICKQKKCKILYFLTVDGRQAEMCIISILAKLVGIRTIANYYLYSRMHAGISGFLWRKALFLNVPDCLFVSDPKLEFAGDYRSRYPNNVHWVPDPYDPLEFTLMPQNAARELLGGLPNSAIIYLMFGDLSKRKGVDKIMEYCLAYELPKNCIIMFAGRLEDALRPLASNLKEKNQQCLFFDRYIEEEEVSSFFCSADYVISAYPKYFDVSSGSVTRACAAGKPLLASNHGVIAEFTATNDVGFLFDCDSLQEFEDALWNSINALNQPWYQLARNRLLSLADARTVDVYGDQITSRLSKFLI